MYVHRQREDTTYQISTAFTQINDTRKRPILFHEDDGIRTDIMDSYVVIMGSMRKTFHVH